MEFIPTEIPDVVVISPDVLTDERGDFLESWHERKFSDAGVSLKFVQDNHILGVRHSIRGLHYQIQHSQGKLARVVTGAVYDVAVDMRRSSPTFGHWVGVELSENNRRILWVPPGFAHGFLVLSGSANFVYRCTDFWAPKYERAIVWNDPDINIAWPLDQGTTPILSAKDEGAPRFRRADCFP